MRADWYFDFISPYAYLQWRELRRKPPSVELRYRPILFAGLLKHWGQLGPAEIAPKRTFTYRHCLWLAARRGVPLRAPQGHPFNPLPFLRLCLAAGNRSDAIERIFAHVWAERGELTRGDGFDRLARDLGVSPGEIDADAVKAELRGNTEAAIASGVFGVPTLVADGLVLWGQDAIGMLETLSDDADAFDRFDAELAGVRALAERPRGGGQTP